MPLLRIVLRILLAGGVPLTRIAGIPVTLSLSFFPMALFLIVMMSQNAPPWAAALFIVLLFGSVLLHEFGHALTARHYGIVTSRISLHFFGGVARMDREPRRPLEEFWIASAGPIVSLCIASCAFLGTQAAVALELADVGRKLLSDLFIINLMLGLFNLLPGYPMDGGRLLRAFLWKRWRNQRRATLAASRGGEIVGYGLVALGLFEVFQSHVVQGFMTALMGFFINGLAASHRALALARTGDFVLPDGHQEAWDRRQQSESTSSDPTAGRYVHYEMVDTARRAAREPHIVSYLIRHPDGREEVREYRRTLDT
ncbi:MAG: site-2 protease family protein [Planctomycetota bacterium]